MISPWTRFVAATFFALALTPAMAQDYPSRLIHIIVPYPPGGGTDTVTRLIAPKLSEALKQPVIVENRPGASTNIATEFVAKAAPDGYTLLLQAPNLATNEAMFSKLAWSLRDFTGVIQLVRYSNVLIAGPGAKVADFKDLLAQSKANPKAFSYGTPGVGSLSHLSTELLKTRTGLAIEHIGYKGSAPISADLLGGHLPLATDNLNSQINNIRGGKVKPIVVLSSRRDPAAPEVPSLSDFGLADFEGGGWYGIVAPARTPAPIAAVDSAPSAIRPESTYKSGKVVQTNRATSMPRGLARPASYGRMPVRAVAHRERENQSLCADG